MADSAVNEKELSAPIPMTSRSFFKILSIVFLLVGSPGLVAQEAAAGEKAKIEALISQIEGLEGAKFIRNGSEYDSKAAAKFLRGKWQAHAKEIKTAADFIAVAATRSSTTGKPYMIRLKGSAEVPCGDYLTAQLKKRVAARAP